jgi:hypothetical protein
MNEVGSCSPPNFQAVVPARVQAAQSFLHWFQGRAGQTPFGGTETPPEPSKKELAAYHSALEIMRQYFSCEMDFGDCQPTTIRYDSPDDPKEPVPVTP